MNTDFKFVDLHLHTNKSDGTLSPKELVQLAHRENIGMMAITDHDTVKGVREGIDEARKLGVDFVTGVEISSKYSGGVLHILGYGLEIDDPNLRDNLAEFQTARQHRNDKIIAKLQKLGIDITKEELLAYAKETVSLGRVHIAAILVKKKVVKDIADAFKHYLGKKGQAFVDKEIFSPAETISMIHQAGGKAFVAHPSSLKRHGNSLSDYITQLCQEGLDGIEGYSTLHTMKEIEIYRKLANEMDLLISGGSDYHGSIKPNIQIACCNNGERISQKQISGF